MVGWKQTWAAGVVVAAVASVGSIATAEPPAVMTAPSGASAATTSQDPAEILRRASKFLASQPQFALTVSDMMDESAPDGQKIQRSKHSAISLRRPDRVAATVRGDDRNYRFAYDGKTVTVLGHAGEQYVRLAAPDTADAMFDELANRYGLTMPSTDILLTDPGESLLKNIRSAKYVGPAVVLGTPAHHLAFRQETVDWQIWIAAEGDPVPLKLVITYKELPGDPQYIAFYHQWNFDPKLEDSAFKLDVPAGAKQVELQPMTPAGGQ